MADPLGQSLSQLSISSSTLQVDDWDRSMSEDPESATGNKPNTVSFPGNDEEQSSTPVAGGKGKRTLSELLKLHAEKGTDVNFTAEEATRVAEVLGQWINSSSSPYEGEDDFFSRPHSQDDISVAQRSVSGASTPLNGRPRGQSESVVKSS
ncbi:hypothetical protein QCA50_018251 [Cerrena zonata]|uniref:Uncharacterized protein n=1 Tax=Cerrena zonata TaxID=2478898 RepID=A0AAW0FPP4_9APHY